MPIPIIILSTTVLYVLRARDIPDFNEPECLRVCSVPSAARALRGWLEGSLKSGMSRVYGVHNMFSAEQISSVYAHCRVSKHREFERCEKETREQDRHLVRDC